MCKSLYSNFFGLSTLSDSNPVSRRFCSIDSICLTLFSLSLSLNNQPTNQPLAITKTRQPLFPPKKNLAARVEKKEKKTYQTGLLHIHTYIHKSTERTGMSTKKERTEDKRRKKQTLLSDDLKTYGRGRGFLSLFQKSKWRT